jgi:release factor glutamine methyltransferase
MTVNEAVRHGEEMLRRSGIADARWNVERLLLIAMRVTRAQLYSNLRKELAEAEQTDFEALLARRGAHEPLAYIEGTQEFYGREFYVNRHVLIPRPETEEVIRAALDLQLPSRPVILDLGAGSGNLAITLALEISGSRVWALEKSRLAIEVILKNAKRRVHTVCGDLHQPPFQTRCFDLIVSNPPYVEAHEYPGLPAETRHEPRSALVPHSAPDVYRSLLKNATNLLKSGGYLIFEIGAGQEDLIEKLILEQGGMSKVGSRRDFQKILRTFILQKF